MYVAACEFVVLIAGSRKSDARLYPFGFAG